MKKTVLLVFAIIIGLVSYAQQLPLGSCGIVCTYDASGNRLRRVYFCNNGVDPYPVRQKQEEVIALKEFLLVEALYPNPTTGKFYVMFSRELKNAKVTLTDIHGKVIQQFFGSGHKLNFDLYGVANGVYMVRIEDNDLVVTKKVIKQ